MRTNHQANDCTGFPEEYADQGAKDKQTPGYKEETLHHPLTLDKVSALGDYVYLEFVPDPSSDLARVTGLIPTVGEAVLQLPRYMGLQLSVPNDSPQWGAADRLKWLLCLYGVQWP